MPYSKRAKQIGIDRLVRLQWLEKTTNLLLAGNEAPEVKLALQEELSGAFRSNNTKVRGSIDKSITILLKIWSNVPKELLPLKEDGHKLLRTLHRENHIAVHWGMTMAVYPFWGAVATQTGRLLNLQGSAAASQVQRRIMEDYGERETVSRRVRYVLRSFLDWGVLEETSQKGIYTSREKIVIDDVHLISWLLEASLYARNNNSSPMQDLLSSPSLFPFQINPIHAGVLAGMSPRLECLRHGVDQDLIMLKNQSAL
ncbi:hypothetical protein SAMN02745216_04788 [Desulfatibacillum alkenivorans DSM 16219]|jgi:hypothetical protein|uniref:Uncharacterized protein n=1 Tax=Desulfatibacillum alkenivorans DSM 16219 TaxID=1121393 RepID=A0A1M6YMA1_9BACT|nr:hypothetical protein [Desulfatibacillum alkenivorans]SHL19222.1 hypothetical protein SAMN02745216_04788 [Desulfatibacillum alkenivorans DSM 16219]